MLLRDSRVFDRLRAACRPDFLWEAADERLPLWRLTKGDARSLAARLSCDQDIASDGFFSLGMLADFDASLQAFGPSFYRHLFWETGMVGQVLYLEAEAAGARATGIGCFFDDAVHDVLGLRGHAFQSLYHFTVGMPVDDGRLTTEPGYHWEEPLRPQRRRTQSTPRSHSSSILMPELCVLSDLCVRATFHCSHEGAEVSNVPTPVARPSS